jgi:hypothetical protein
MTARIEDFRPLIATPCYGGMIHEGYLRGFSSFIVSAIELGMKINLATVINESLVTRARNELVKYLMKSDSTHLFFIDADIQFKAEDVVKLLAHDKDIVVGSYPLKGVRWDYLKDEDIKNIKTVDELKQRTPSYVVNYKFASEENFQKGLVNVQDGLIELDVAGTGFMCIKRHVIEQMIEKMPELHYKKEENYLQGIDDDGIRWALFDSEIDKERGYFLSEDYTFCKRWQRLGGQVWLDPTIKLTHWGTYAFQGQDFFRFNDALGSEPTSSFMRG